MLEKTGDWGQGTRDKGQDRRVSMYSMYSMYKGCFGLKMKMKMSIRHTFLNSS